MSRRIETIKTLICDQRDWITRCGGSLSAYVERYGSPGEARCRGDGGEAIYEADTNALKWLEDELLRLTTRRSR